ncbi:transporter substrate-binding domain-containing protein [Alkalimarinus alittae]|uniref:Transporter substrate-binding domain-containing protein n=1 Tax=Alkalimarinus alittae TaxID=2961619 RepID=A0ABY6N3S0_9ALTE|nr:transporter substrate-binding domain-containing protein [Alkalimarinus alittae]UZE96734.1 transporter substrate-binding domain-containing protein [Alkalimarinus alittae]
MKLLFNCLLMSVISLDLWAAESLTLKIAGYDYPPLYHLNERDQVEGEFVDVFKKMCQQQGISCKFTAISAARTYKQLEDGDIDILLTGKIPRFNECCIVSDWSYQWVGGIYSREKIETEIDSSLLKGRSLVIPLGFELPHLVFKDLKELESNHATRVIEARTARLTLKMFGKGRGDFLWSSSETGPLLREYSDNKESPYYFYPLKTIPVVAWINRTNPHYETILNGFNRSYANLKASKVIADDGLMAR